MKIGIIKMGSSMSFDNSRSVGIVSGEPLNLANLLKSSGHEIVIGGKKTSRTMLEHPNYSGIKLVDLVEEHGEFLDCDHLILWCGFINFWGGVEDRHVINQYKIINKFNGPISYILTDSDTPPIQLWPKMESKDWAKPYNKDDIWVSRDDIDVYTQGTNIEFIKTTIPENFKYRSIQSIDLWKMPALYPIDKLELNPRVQYDLGYGGISNRVKRNKKIVKYFFNNDPEISSCVFGRDLTKDKGVLKLLSDDIGSTQYAGSVKYGQGVIDFQNTNLLATVVIGDPDYEQSNLIPNRFVEAVLAKNVAFIDIDLDPKRLLIKNKTLNDFLYVSSYDEVSDKIKQLKNSEEFRSKIIELQDSELGDLSSIKQHLTNEFNVVLNY